MCGNQAEGDGHRGVKEGWDSGLVNAHTTTYVHKWGKEIESELSLWVLRGPRTQSSGHLWGFKDLCEAAENKLSDGDSVPVTCPWLSGDGIHPPTQSARPSAHRKNTNKRRGSSLSALGNDTSLNQDSHRKWLPTTGPQSLQRLRCPGRCQGHAGAHQESRRKHT